MSNAGTCLVAKDAEPMHLIHCYDSLPKAVRLALQESAFNICSACTRDAFVRSAGGWERADVEEVAIRGALRWIRETNHELRARERRKEELLRRKEAMREPRF